MARKSAKWTKSKGKTSKNDQKSKQKSQKQIFEGCLTPKAPKLSFPGVWVGGEWGSKNIGTGSGGQEGRGRGTRTGARDMGQGTGTGTREHLHVDKNNDGPSYIIALGEYQGDRL